MSYAPLDFGMVSKGSHNCVWVWSQEWYELPPRVPGSSLNRQITFVLSYDRAGRIEFIFYTVCIVVKQPAVCLPECHITNSKVHALEKMAIARLGQVCSNTCCCLCLCYIGAIGHS